MPDDNAIHLVRHHPPAEIIGGFEMRLRPHPNQPQCEPQQDEQTESERKGQCENHRHLLCTG
jgi:hypothetical protein